MSTADFGMLGLGVMGQNLALNIESRGFSVAVWNRAVAPVEAFVRAHPGDRFLYAPELQDLVASVRRPRRLMLMVKAGPPVDEMIERLRPLLDPGDMIIDGGNSWFGDTQRREAALADAGLHFVGVGVSGGEEGARIGPSIMPGGSAEAYAALAPIFEQIAAQTDAGPCVTHVGPNGAGHFVKMVHNGIEYGDMQLIAEAYDLLQRVAGLDHAAIAEVFARWNEGPLASFLIDLTATVCRKIDPETGKPLVTMVLDKAGQKGTGKWTAQVALDLGVPIPTITAAVDARVISSMKEERVAAGAVLRGPGHASAWADRTAMIADIERALEAAKICAYDQGMRLIHVGSREYRWDVNRAEVARIWKGGCIIRAALLDPIRAAYGRDPQLTSLLFDPTLRARVDAAQEAWRRVVSSAGLSGVPVPGMAASLNYFDSYRTPRLPQNLTQAQRDAFGAHTYERTDRAGTHHSEWD